MRHPFEVVELGANVDENRPLLDDGTFRVELAGAATIKRFKTAEEARAAGEAAPNRRRGYPLFVVNADKMPTARVEGEGA